MKFEMILFGHKLKQVSGVVVNRWNIRALEHQEEEGGDFNDDGPLQKNASKVFNVSIRESEGHGEIVVYFYDLWAEKLSFVQPGDILHMSGGISMIHRYRITDYDHPNCIVYSEGYNECQLRVDSRNIINEERSVFMTSATIRNLEVPLDDFSHKKKRQRMVGPRAITAPPARGTQASAATHQHYEYTPLAAIQPGICPQGGLHLYGVVFSYHQPKPCRGSHKWSASYTVVSPPLEGASTSTRGGYEHVRPVHLIYFANDPEQFPQIDCVGVVIRLHRVTVGSFQGLPQIVGRQYKSSFVVFKRRVDEVTMLPVPPSVPNLSGDASANLLDEADKYWQLCPSSPNFSFAPSELPLLLQLFDWAVGFFATISYTTPLPVNQEGGGAGGASTAVPSRDFHISFRRQHRQITDCGAEAGRFTGIDCVGLVLSIVDDSSDPSLPSCRLVVWDGTCDGLVRPYPSSGTAQCGRVMCTEIEADSFKAVMTALRLSYSYAETNLSAAAVQEQCIADFLTNACVNRIGSVPTLLEGEGGGSLLGGRGVVAICSDASLQGLVARQLRPGTWIRMRMLSSSPLAELSSESARILASSSINVLPPYHRDVLDTVRSFEKFMRTRRAVNNPQVTSFPRRIVAASGEFYAPLAVCVSAAAPAEFLTLVRIASWHPSSPHRFVVDRSSGEVPGGHSASESHESQSPQLCGQFKSGHDIQNLVYMFSLRIFDDTASTDAVVFGKNGTCLFNGVSAASYLADSRIRIELERYLDRVVAEGTIFELRLITYKTFPSRVGASGNGQNGHNRWGWYCDGITTLYTIILPFCNLIG